ncbi:hypothetical protein GCM10012275_20590 [Longimycelium tulufanense]|uniref:Uncharacterized protein n=1 Tax=Longimycelium tulufanense TaxID=907463 RepID=A0A8J3C7G7_9PSEU|nr:hypothetical protein GCM10012275_20590 [Longimycelium tulufanense]
MLSPGPSVYTQSACVVWKLEDAEPAIDPGMNPERKWKNLQRHVGLSGHVDEMAKSLLPLITGTPPTGRRSTISPRMTRGIGKSARRKIFWRAVRARTRFSKTLPAFGVGSSEAALVDQRPPITRRY